MRLIDADAMIAYEQENHCDSCKDAGNDHCGAGCVFCSYDEIIGAVNKYANGHQINKNGQWTSIATGSKRIKCYGGDYMRHYNIKQCSSCHTLVDVEYNHYSYCPYCGAKMSRDNDESY